MNVFQILSQNVSSCGNSWTIVNFDWVKLILQPASELGFRLPSNDDDAFSSRLLAMLIVEKMWNLINCLIRENKIKKQVVRIEYRAPF